MVNYPSGCGSIKIALTGTQHKALVALLRMGGTVEVSMKFPIRVYVSDKKKTVLYKVNVASEVSSADYKVMQPAVRNGVFLSVISVVYATRTEDKRFPGRFSAFSQKDVNSRAWRGRNDVALLRKWV